MSQNFELGLVFVLCNVGEGILKKKKKILLGIPPCVLYHWIEIKSAYFLMYCLSVHLN